MAKKKKEFKDDSPKAPFWMTTYGDMVTLLLTFFILMFAMSTISERKFMQAARSLQEALGGGIMEGSISVIGEESMTTGTSGLTRADIDILETLEQIAAMMEDEALSEMTSMEIIGAGEVLIRLGDEMLFDPGKAVLKPGARRILRGITESIIGTTQKLWVEGHTDNVPIYSRQFPSNWELSTARALSVVKYLQRLGIPSDQLAAVGHSEYVPLTTNDTPQGRQTNRRVELYITWREVPFYE